VAGLCKLTALLHCLINFPYIWCMIKGNIADGLYSGSRLLFSLVNRRVWWDYMNVRSCILNGRTVAQGSLLLQSTLIPVASGQLHVSEITWFSHCGRLQTDRRMSNSLQEKRVHGNPLVMISGWLNWLWHKTCIHSVPDKLRAGIQRP
jgi:hypothetical protein